VVNALTEKYVAECVDGPLRTAVRDATYPPAFAAAFQPALLPRPLLVDEGEIRRWADDLSVIFDLLVSLPRRLFDGDLERYCVAAGIDAQLAALMTRDVTGDPPRFLRSDAFYDGATFRLLELNSGSELGGLEIAAVNRSLLGVEAFQDFAARHELSYVDTADMVAGVLRDVAACVTSSERPLVALVEATGGLAAHGRHFASIQEAMVSCGLDFRLGEVQQLGITRGKLTLEGAPVDVVMRYFAAGEILQCPAGPSVLEPILEAHRNGKTVLYTTLESSLFASKGSLALLSDPRFRSSFDAGERRLIDRVVPWTRLLVGDDQLVEHCLANRDRLIVKPSVGWGAAGAVAGPAAGDDEWRALVTSRLDQGYVAQEIVTPVPEPVCDPDTGMIEDWYANWGVFVTRAGYSGAIVRALKPADGRVIALSRHGTRLTSAFSFAGDPGPGDPGPGDPASPGTQPAQ